MGKDFEVVKCEEVRGCGGLVGVFEGWGDVVVYAALVVGLGEERFEVVEVVVGGGWDDVGFVLGGE